MSPRIDSLLKNERNVELDTIDIEKLFLISYSKLRFEFLINGSSNFLNFWLVFNSEEEIVELDYFDEVDFVPTNFDISKFEKKYIDMLQRNLEYVYMELYDNEESDPDEYEYSCNILDVSEDDLNVLNSQKVKYQILKSLYNFDSKDDKFYDELKDFIAFAFK